MLNKHPVLKKAVSLLLSFAIVLPASVALIGDSGTAEAASSFNYIEQLKSRGGAFNILEIAPAGADTISQGSIGYYISGQEPCKSFAADAETYALDQTSDSNTMQDRRKSYVSNVFNNLKTLGIMGDTGAKPADNPLTLTEAYDEKYPWQLDAMSDTDDAQKTEKAKYISTLKLQTPDIVTVHNVFTKAEPIGAGKYNILSNFRLANSNGHTGETANFVQVIDRFTNIENQISELTGTVYCYNPVFTQANADQLGSGEGALDGATPLYINQKDTGETKADNYIYVGTKSGTTLEENGKYYYVTSTGAPVAATKTTNPDGTVTTILPNGCPYAAVSTSFRSVSTGETPYFVPEGGRLQYQYVGAGGAYNYGEGAGPEADIITDTVFYKGGFRSNNWFLRYVLDCEEQGGALKMPELSLNVTCVTPDKATAEELAKADMVVLSGGLKQSGGNAAAYSSDLTAAVKNSILSSAKGKNNAIRKAVVVDSRVEGCSAANVKAVWSDLNSYVGSKYVKGSVFVFHNDSDYQNLATKNFAKALSGNQYSEVSDYIEKVQKIWGSTRKMSDDVARLTLAHVIRHTINACEPVSVKADIKVLDIEPAKSYEQNNSKTVLSFSSINDWAGRGSNDQITGTIKTMSTAEFIGTIDDLAEDYDMIYIGSSIGGFSKTLSALQNESVVDYYDDDMDGLVYTNIGDKVLSGGASGFNLSGLLDRDYSSNDILDNGDHKLATGHYVLNNSTDNSNLNNTTRTFRYPGNDLTAQAVKRLEDYASIGHPIIVASDLRSGYDVTAGAVQGTAQYTHSIWPAPPHSHTCHYNTTVTLSGTTLSEKEILAPAIDWDLSTSGQAMDFTRAWYVDNRDGNGFTSTRKGDTSLDMSDYADGTLIKYNVHANKVGFGGPHDSDYKDTSAYDAFSQTVILYKNTVNQAKVDNSSNMFTFLNETISTPTVFDAGLLGSNDKQKDLNLYLGVSKPTLEGYSGPTEYSETDTKSVKSLDYTFTVKDDVNKTASYAAHLYVDTNGDGRYQDGEELDSLSVSDSASGSPVPPDKLKAGVQYSLKRALPPKLAGIVPWKLVLVQNGNPAVRVTKTGYAHASGTPQRLNILQIQSSGKKGNTTNIATDSDYRNLFGKISSDYDIHVYYISAADLGDAAKCYDSLANNKPNADYFSTVWNAYKAKHAGVTDFWTGGTWNSDSAATKASIDSFLDSFDMLILGFADSYDGIAQRPAEAIVRYISSQKAVLFTHDCTSFYSLPAADYPTENCEGTAWGKFTNLLNKPWYVYSSKQFATGDDFSWYTGYTFNTVIRSSVGLDRYGVTDASCGRTKMSNPALSASGFVANNNDGKGLDEPQRQQLQKANYSVAYKPKSNKAETVPETQGFTTNILTRYYRKGVLPYGYGSGTGSGLLDKLFDYMTDDQLQNNELETTTKVRQVNKGQITTYPFDVNTSAFSTGKPNDFLSIAPTHMQYYQLNMNSDDIVVWYCLAEGGSHPQWIRELLKRLGGKDYNPNTLDYMTNDVTDQYYIYSRGNVTYSGAGHSSSQTIDEKKLFVNTIVAAFRHTQTAPALELTDSNGVKSGITSIYVPSDGTPLKTSGLGADTGRNIYFKIENTSLSKDTEKAVYSVTKAYTLASNQTETALPATVQVYDGSDTVVESGHLSAGVVYHLKLDEIGAIIWNGDSSKADGAVLAITPHKTVNGGTPLDGEPVKVTLRCVGLWELG